MFKAIQNTDRTGLRQLARVFVRTGNAPAALLCLDHLFSSPLRLRNLSLAEVQASLSLYLDYIRLLNRFRSDESLAEGSNRQRSFGFQALGGNRYLVPEHTLLYGKLTNRSDSAGKSTDGYRCEYDEIRLGIIQLISSRIDDHTKIQNNTCRNIHGFSPCLGLLVQGECTSPKGKGSCPFQHIQPEQLTVDWYHARLRLILLQFRILHSARCDDPEVKKYVLAQSARNLWMLIKHEVTGSGYCIRHFIRPFRDSDHSQISRLPGYPREPMGSRSYENGLRTSVVTSGITNRDLRTALDNGSWLHARLPSTLIEKTPWISFLTCRCTGRHYVHNPCIVGRGS